MVNLLKAEMLRHAESAGFLIDGFPRELENGDKLFKEKVQYHVTGMPLILCLPSLLNL